MVNFSSSETFYSDKRPFFSENHSLFDVKNDDIFYIINTRRIGAAPDYNCPTYAGELEKLCEASAVGVTDIDYAMRYTQQAESLDFGLLTASEADAPYSEGKDFYALRLNKNSEKFSLGYLGTFTERPVINREATVHALDLTYRPTDQLRLSTVLMGSNIEQESRSSGATDNTSGQAFNIDVTASPKKNRWHNMSMFYFDDQVDINDMGYQMINNWSFISNQNGFKFTEFNPDSFLLSSELGVAFGIETNGKFETASRSVQLDYKSNFKNTSGLTIENFYRDASKDFWITRNDLTAPFINKPANYGTKIQFFGPSSNRFSYGLTFAREKGSAWFSALGFSTTYTAMANFTPRDNLKFSLTYQHNDEEHWLNWIENNLLGTYTKKTKNDRCLDELVWW